MALRRPEINSSACANEERPQQRYIVSSRSICAFKAKTLDTCHSEPLDRLKETKGFKGKSLAEGWKSDSEHRKVDRVRGPNFPISSLYLYHLGLMVPPFSKAIQLTADIHQRLLC
jgi:hypothetical protein